MKFHVATKKEAATAGVYERLRAGLEIVAQANELTYPSLISEKARLAVVLPIQIRKEDFDPEDWEFGMKDADTFRWIKLDLNLSGDMAEVFLRTPLIKDISWIEDWYISRAEQPPSLLQPEGHEDWDDSPILTSELPDLDLRQLVEFEFFRA
jgi:hypothetical protein